MHLRLAPVEQLEDAVRVGLREHAAGERALVADLRRALTPEEQRQLAEALAKALVRSPTRPHPATRHGAWTGGLTFWFGGLVDRQRDVMDSRSVPTPHRPPVLRPMTRWGAYALGAHQDPHQGRSEGPSGP